MPVKYVVHASIVDIEKDSPRIEDSVLVDTNVWLWMCYGRASLSLDVGLHQLTTYPSYLKKMLAIGAKLYRSSLSFAELSHLVEKVEHECYVRKSGNNITLKEYRHNVLSERGNVVSEVTSAWGQVKEIATILELTLNEATTNQAVTRFKNQLLDGYDLYLLESLSAANKVQLLSHDGDFCTVPGITLFTANQTVISAAKIQGKLVSR